MFRGTLTKLASAAAASSAAQPVISSPTTVTFMGGFSMKPKHIKKYQDLYNGTDVDNFRLISRSIPQYTQYKPARAKAEEMAATYETLPGNHVFHIFSGSYFTWHEFMQLASDDLRSRMTGTVFDSTPLPPTSKSFARYLAFATKTNYHPSMELPFDVYRKAFGITKWQSESWQPNLYDVPSDNVLLLSSKEDKVSCPDFIADFAEKIADKRNVTHVAFKEGIHANLIKHNPEQYKEALHVFLKESLEFTFDTMDQPQTADAVAQGSTRQQPIIVPPILA